MHYFDSDRLAQIQREEFGTIILQLSEIRDIIGAEDVAWAMDTIAEYAEEIFSPEELAEYERQIDLLESDNLNNEVGSEDIEMIDGLVGELLSIRDDFLKMNALLLTKVALLNYSSQN